MYHFSLAAPAAFPIALSFGTTLSRHFWQLKTRWLSLLLLLCATVAQAAPPEKKWNGSASANWNTPANWTPAAVPVAGDSVIISGVPDNQPIILSGTMAKGKNVRLSFGSTLTINTGGELELASTLNVYGLANNGTVANSGTLKVKSGFSGIDNYGTFTNNGTILLGEAGSSPYSFTEEGIRLTVSGSNFTNNSTGNITIRRAGNNGILLFNNDPVFTNYGEINIIEAGLNPATAATGDGIDIRKGSFINESTGDITISKISANGVKCRGGTSFTNEGMLTLSQVGLTPELETREGIENSGTVNNTATGQISIEMASNNGILSQGNFTNSGHISIGTATANSIGGNGLANLGAFNNNSGAVLNVKNTASKGLLSGGFGGVITNYSGGTINIGQIGEDGIFTLGFGGVDNQGSIQIGSTGSITGDGIHNGAQFSNQSTAALTILNTGGPAINNFPNPNLLPNIVPLFKNAGQLTIGNAASASSAVLGISNITPSSFENLLCGALTTYQKISNGGTFLNEAFLFALGNGAQSNSGTFTNDGVIHDPNGTFNGVAITNNDFIISAATGECPVANALQKGTGANVTIGTTWYKDAARTMSAGTYNQAANAFTVSNLSEGMHTLYLVATDNQYGCTQAMSVKITYDDVTKPTITCPADATVAADLSCNGPVGVRTLLSKSDLCAASGSITESQNPAANALITGHNTAQTVTLTANDGNGNTQTCQFTVTLKDGIKPTITCPADATVAADGNCSGMIGPRTLASKSDNCTASGSITESQSPATNALITGHNTAQTVTLTANDGNGNTQTCQFSVTLKDGIKPTITCPVDATVAADVSCSGIIGPRSLAFKSDNCTAFGSITEMQSPAAATVLSGHNTAQTVTLTANDGNGNTQTCQFTVTLKDGIKPTITCPADATVAADGNCSGMIGPRSLASKSDNCTAFGSITENQSPATNALITGHNTAQTVTLTANDGNGNTQTCQFTVTLKDVTKPIIICPANIIRGTDPGGCTAAVTFANATATDNCGSVSVEQTAGLASGSNFPAGNPATVTFKASDGAAPANTATCSFTVTVLDIQPPTMVCPANQTMGNTANQCSAIVTYATPSAADNCALAVGSPTLQSGPASGGLFPKGQTTVVWLATDQVGLTKTCSFRITVNDTQAPTIGCPGSQSVNTGPGSCSSAAVTYATPTATDNCAPSPTVVRIGGPVSGSTFSTGTTVVTWRAIDGAGRSSTCTFSVTVTDNQPPNISCPGPITQNNPPNACNTSVVYATPTATDNCGVNALYLQSGLSSSSTFPVGVTTNVWYAVDNNGLSSTCAFTVTINCGVLRGVVNAESSTPNTEFLKADLTLSLAPNPAVAEVRFAVSGLDEKAGELMVFDGLGRLVLRQTLAPEQGNGTFDVSALPEGLYRISLRTERKVVTKGLMVSK